MIDILIPGERSILTIAASVKPMVGARYVNASCSFVKLYGEEVHTFVKVA